MMRILMLAHRLPYPPTTGDKVRAYHVARHLAASQRLTLACLMDEPNAEQALARLRREIPDVEAIPVRRRLRRGLSLLNLTVGGSATMGYFHSRALHRVVRRRLESERFDLIYVSSSSMAQYVPAGTAVPVVLDLVDVDSDKWLQFASRLPFPVSVVYRLEGRRLRQVETAASRVARRCLVATRAEDRLLRRFAPWANSTVVPNGVDLEYFTPAASPPASPTIVFTGAMDYFPNVDAVAYFVERVFPLVRRMRVDARFVIVGKNPVAEVRRLAAVPGVVVTGSVADVRPYLRDARVAVAPLRLARGVQNKVLEAMASGLPVVATSRAYEGLEATPGEHLLVEDEPERLASATVRLLDDADARARLGGAARRFVEEHHSWAMSLAAVDRLLAEMHARCGGRPPCSTAAPAVRIEEPVR